TTNTNWFFSRTSVNHTTGKLTKSVSPQITKINKRKDSDEHYVIDLCDEILGLKGTRQKRFPFLLGDEGKNGRRMPLPVDVYYESLNLVIEFNECQHTAPLKHFD